MSEASTTTKKESLYITYSRAKDEYGLTDKMFTMIGKPDKTAPNPHYKKAAPMRLYAIERLEAWVAKNLVPGESQNTKAETQRGSKSSS